MQITTAETLPGCAVVEHLGIVRGNVVRSKHIGSDIVAWFRSLVGGEVREYTALLSGAREQAFDRMCADAEAKGADAIIAMRFSTSMIMRDAAEIMAYGTAVKVKSAGSQ